MNKITFDKILKSKYFGISAITVALLAVLIVLFIDGSDTKYVTNSSSFNEFEYTAELENKIDNIVSEINGAGDAVSMVSIENSYEKLYAKQISEAKQNSQSTGSEPTHQTQEDYDEQIIIIDNGENENAVEITEYTPKITGVVIVCEGGGNREVRESVINAVSTLLGISEEKVCVLKSK